MPIEAGEFIYVSPEELEAGGQAALQQMDWALGQVPGPYIALACCSVLMRDAMSPYHTKESIAWLLHIVAQAHDAVVSAHASIIAEDGPSAPPNPQLH